MTRENVLGGSIEWAMRLAGVAGLSAALVEGGQVVWSGGFGRVQTGSRVSADTVFAVASLSKPPFAHLVLGLCGRGLLDLDTPLAEYGAAPYGAAGLDPDASEVSHITARHVLAHTSGLGNFEERDAGRIGFRPGSRWRYSGEGYLYLQAVVEHVTGLPLERVAHADVFQPLGMTSTSYLWRPDDESSATSSHGHEYRKAFAAWSLHTTARDYARFVADTMHSEIGEALLTPQVEIEDSLAWSLGWGLAGDLFWHWGDMGFDFTGQKEFQSVAVASRARQRGLVCLTNSEHGLRACVDILREAMGDDFSYPIRVVLERGW